MPSEAPIPAALNLTPVAATLPDIKPETENPANSAPTETKAPAQPITHVPERSSFLPPPPAVPLSNTKPSFASMAAKAKQQKPSQTAAPMTNPKPQTQNQKTPANDSPATKAKQIQTPQPKKIAGKGWN